jgi:hypothetical protein
MQMLIAAIALTTGGMALGEGPLRSCTCLVAPAFREAATVGTHQLDPVPEGIRDVASLDADVDVVGQHLDASGAQPLAERCQIGHQEGRVGLLRGSEPLFDAEVNVRPARTGEPASASSDERSRLRDLLQTEEIAVELARPPLSARRHGHLHVIEPDHVRIR